MHSEALCVVDFILALPSFLIQGINNYHLIYQIHTEHVSNLYFTPPTSVDERVISQVYLGASDSCLLNHLIVLQIVLN